MTEQTGAAAPTAEQAAPSAPAESEQATPAASVQTDAAPANAETPEKPETEGDEGSSEERRKLTRNQRLQRKAARLATMVAEQAAKIEQLERQGGKPDADLPKAADYAQGEYDPSYVADLAAHKAAKKISAELSERDKRSTQEKIAERRDEAADEFLERADQLKTKIPDFDATISSYVDKGGQFAPHVIEELHESEHGPMLAYQLAKNPALAAQLNSLSPRDAAREIGRLEAKVSLPQPKKQTQAPPPITPPSGGASPSKDLHALAKSDDISGFVKLREEQEKAKRR
jgi:hypothetical protein